MRYGAPTRPAILWCRSDGCDALNMRIVERHHLRQLSSGWQTCRLGLLGSSRMHGGEGHDEERHQDPRVIPNLRLRVGLLAP
jgi:hypothetical protein